MKVVGRPHPSPAAARLDQQHNASSSFYTTSPLTTIILAYTQWLLSTLLNPPPAPPPPPPPPTSPRVGLSAAIADGEEHMHLVAYSTSLLSLLVARSNERDSIVCSRRVNATIRKRPSRTTVTTAHEFERKKHDVRAKKIVEGCMSLESGRKSGFLLFA
ncbi:hypothetical protein BDY19DRAFT_729135 [Irpex rosettiformis]|uniref:Uncharacterized protein n=1 Tax=Irpex rosettiformis TaxID=378272 RepID=A0ACB8U8H5_9APHY|nr:hypothetical protein BDY19DRAFT_729135 [Irpex rosettiformis]